MEYRIYPTLRNALSETLLHNFLTHRSTHMSSSIPHPDPSLHPYGVFPKSIPKMYSLLIARNTEPPQLAPHTTTHGKGSFAMIFRITYTYFGAPRTSPLDPTDYFDALSIANHLRASAGCDNINILPMGVTF